MTILFKLAISETSAFLVILDQANDSRIGQEFVLFRVRFFCMFMHSFFRIVQRFVQLRKTKNKKALLREKFW